MVNLYRIVLVLAQGTVNVPSLPESGGFEWTTYGPLGIIIGILTTLARVGWNHYKERQKIADDLNDTIATSLRAKDTEHTKSLSDLVQAVNKLETESRDKSKQLAAILHNQRQMWLLTATILRLITPSGSGEERRKTLTDGEISRLIKQVREEYGIDKD